MSDLIDQTTNEWKHSLLHNLVALSDIAHIKSLRPTRSPRPNAFVWTLTKSGVYSVKPGYNLAMENMEPSDASQVLEPSTTGLKAKVWKLKTTKKIQHFIWQVVSNCVPVCSSLVDRHCRTDRACPRCGTEEETCNHLLFECHPAVQTWALADLPQLLGLFPSSSIYSSIDHALWRAKEYSVPESILDNIPWVIWYI